MTVEAPEEFPAGADQPDRTRADGRMSSAVWDLLLFQTAALTLQVVAVSMAWSGETGTPNIVSCLGFAVTFASALWALMRPQLDRAVRNIAVVCLGVTTTVQWRMIDPLLFKGYDEQLHMRTLSDIEASHSLFQPHPILPVSPRYPGLEALAAFIHQFGLPLMFAATIALLLARLALVLALCAAVEHITGSARAGGLAVAVYAISPQFVYFNSQFAYQSLAFPLALAAVAFVARARSSDNAKPLYGGATVCLVAVALTHHLTSLLTAAFLVVWALTESKGQARRRVFCGAVVAVLATAMWAAIQWSLLRNYFGPMIEDVSAQLTHGVQRAPFSETSAQPKAAWERLLLVYYAIAITATVGWLTVIRVWPTIRRMRGASGARTDGDGNAHRWQPRLLLVLLAISIPVLFAARIVPKFGEIGDRASTFLYLPFSFLVVGAALHWFRSDRRTRGSRWLAGALRHPRGGVAVRFVVLMLATAGFVGGFLLGAGSEWGRMPGGYLPGGDGRSMDAETLAATRWAGDNLPAGGRIGADRLSSTLLASQARLWPVFLHDDAPEVAWLFQVDEWDEQESDIVRGREIRYLFVDRRFADATPLVGTYFDESPPVKLTASDLTKFDHVRGIEEIYRHGPMSIYDLSGLGVADVRSGWSTQSDPTSVPTQVVIGFLIGISLALITRLDVGVRTVRFVRSILTAGGPSLTFPFGIAALCITSVVMILTQIWLGPWIFVSAMLTLLLLNPHSSIQLARIAAAKFRFAWFAAAGSLVLAIVAAIAISGLHAEAARQLTPMGNHSCLNGDCNENR